MAQLSRMSLLVPVFTAVQKRVVSTLSVPKVRARASGSAKMSPTMNAARASSAWVQSPAAAVGRAAGVRAGVTEGSCQRTGQASPPLARARKALVKCSKSTSLLPSARL